MGYRRGPSREGCAVRAADDPEESGIRSGGGADAGAGDWRDDGDLQLCGCGDVEASAVSGGRTNRERVGEAAGRGAERNIDAEFSGLEEAEHGVHGDGSADVGERDADGCGCAGAIEEWTSGRGVL